MFVYLPNQRHYSKRYLESEGNWGESEEAEKSESKRRKRFKSDRKYQGILFNIIWNQWHLHSAAPNNLLDVTKNENMKIKFDSWNLFSPILSVAKCEKSWAASCNKWAPLLAIQLMRPHLLNVSPTYCYLLLARQHRKLFKMEDEKPLKVL